MKIGIIAAMPEELREINQLGSAPRVESIAGREFHQSVWRDAESSHELVAVLSKVGKVSAAITATLLIERMRVDAIIFVGTAGAVSPALRVGDLVVATALYQHDMDATPLFPRFEIPLTGQSFFATDPEWRTRLEVAARHLCERAETILDTEARALVELPLRYHVGVIASGDQFVKDPGHKASLHPEGHEVLAVEMEGAAVAQVCHDFALPCAVIRTISDTADHDAAVNFTEFTKRVASCYSHVLIEALLAQL